MNYLIRTAIVIILCRIAVCVHVRVLARYDNFIHNFLRHNVSTP
jgi:hypothetical protein